MHRRSFIMNTGKTAAITASLTNRPDKLASLKQGVEICSV